MSKEEDIYKTNIWELFREEFKDGEQVIVIHEDCRLYFGKLTAYEKYCLIGSREIPWGQIVFIAHDGFPCRALHTCLSNEQLDNIENEDSVILMRKLLARKPKEKIITKTHTNTISRFHSFGGGCPFEMQEIQMQILNPYNHFTGDYGNLSLEDYEETLLCQSKDRAVGILWGLDEEIIEFYPSPQAAGE